MTKSRCERDRELEHITPKSSYFACARCCVNQDTRMDEPPRIATMASESNGQCEFVLMTELDTSIYQIITHAFAPPLTLVRSIVICVLRVNLVDLQICQFEICESYYLVACERLIRASLYLRNLYVNTTPSFGTSRSYLFIIAWPLNDCFLKHTN